MAILLELSDAVIKKAALISEQYSGRSLVSIIEECFDYGARSLYKNNITNTTLEIKKREIKPVEELYKEPPTKEEIENIYASAEDLLQRANDKYSDMVQVDYDSSYSDPVITSDGLYEL